MKDLIEVLGFHFTNHAIRRMIERNITLIEVSTAIQIGRVDLKYENHHKKYLMIYNWSDIRVVVDDTSKCIVTVILKKKYKKRKKF